MIRDDDTTFTPEEYLITKASELIEARKAAEDELGFATDERNRYKKLFYGIMKGAKLEVTDGEEPERIVIPAITRAASHELYYELCAALKDLGLQKKPRTVVTKTNGVTCTEYEEA